MEFLTQWRLTLAADLILDPQETVASVARTVGYSSPYALSAAFKRERGISPQQHRTAQRQRVVSA
jgi:AraC-like DNA-binding protein